MMKILVLLSVLLFAFYMTDKLSFMLENNEVTNLKVEFGTMGATTVFWIFISVFVSLI